MSERLTRNDLETLCLDAIAAGKSLIYLEQSGSPDARRARLLGRKRGPYGAVVGWHGPRIIVCYKPERIIAYLDEVDVIEISGEDKLYLAQGADDE